MKMLGQKAMLSGLCRYCQPLSHQVGGHHHASSMIVSGGCRSLAMQVWQPALVLHGMLGLHHQCHAVCRAMCRTLNQPCSQCAVSNGPPVASLAAHDLRICCVDCCATAELFSTLSTVKDTAPKGPSPMHCSAQPESDGRGRASAEAGDRLS